MAVSWKPDIEKLSDDELEPLVRMLSTRGLLPKPKLGDIDDEGLIDELKLRGFKLREKDDDVRDEDALGYAIDYAGYGDIGMCGHYLIRAIPQLYPLGKILGA